MKGCFGRTAFSFLINNACIYYTDWRKCVRKNVHMNVSHHSSLWSTLEDNRETKSSHIILVRGQAFLIDIFCLFLPTVTPPPPPSCISQPYLALERTQRLQCVTSSLTSPPQSLTKHLITFWDVDPLHQYY